MHITGVPGSGKTMLGEILAKQYSDKIAWFDTDDFIQTEDEFLAIKNSPNPNKTRDEIYLTKFKAAIHASQDVRIILFTGILDHGSPDGEFFDGINFDVKIYLNVPLY